MNEIVRIPAIEYLLVFVAAVLVWLIARGVALAGGALRGGPPPAASGD
jgi:hypothetical protein